ncbi:histidine phosphatase superfamily [Pavlovales sp. CCMP2436]|nr:histidine phosphatase superfamily [Pavlovales sp. CCMP2436]
MAPSVATGPSGARRMTRRELPTVFLLALAARSAAGFTSDRMAARSALVQTSRRVTMVTQILLIRHGQVIPPTLDCIYGGMDVPLSELGKRQAIAAANGVSAFSCSHVYSSPLSRAVFGAERVLEAQMSSQRRLVPLSLEDALAEIDRGDWGGLSRAEIEAANPGGLDRLKTDPEFRPPNGESMRDLQTRVIAAFRRILDATPPGETVAIVSHMHVTKVIVSHVLGTPFSEIEIPLASTSLVEIDHESGLAKMVFTGREPDLALAGERDAAGNAWGG